MDKYIAEFVGTAILILLGNGVVANVSLEKTKGHYAGWIVIAFGWGMAVFVAVFCVMDISGAHVNPAVTIGLAAAGEFPWGDVAGYLIAQLLGAMLGACLVYLVYRDHYYVTASADAKLGTFATAPNIRNFPVNMFAELIGTFVLVYAVLMKADPSLEFIKVAGSEAAMPPATMGLGAIGALPVGLLVLAIGLSLGGPTGYAINPARDLGPRIIHSLLPIPGKRNSDWSYAWIPIVGPLAGGLVAALAYKLMAAT